MTSLIGARWRLIAIAASAMVLSGCASLSPDGGIGVVRQNTQTQLGKELLLARGDTDLDTIARRVDELLNSPLDAESVVQMALLNNRGLQAGLQELGIAEAERVQASRLPNPGFSFSRLQRGSEREIGRSFTIDLLHLMTLPLTDPMEQRRLAAVQRSVSIDVLALATEARKAFYAAVAAEQTLRYQVEVKAAADAGAELARRMAQAGNWTRLQQAREHAFYAEATLNLAHAQQAQVASRERLIRLMGLWGTQTGFTLPQRLPDLPAEPADRPDIEQVAMAQRLDVQGAKLQAEANAKNLGLSKVTRLLNMLELGWQNNSSNEAARQTGYEISVEIPLFDWSGARVARAEAIYLQSVHRVAEIAINARSEVREAYLGYRSAYDIACHYRDEIVPTAKRISDENLLRYNGMLIGVFELLADARSQIGAVNASILALRDFWTAEADLQMALIGRPSLSVPAGASVTRSASGPAH